MEISLRQYAPGGAPATAALIDRIHQSLSLARVTVGSTRRRLFQNAKAATFWFARTHPLRLKVDRASQRRDGTWLVHLIGFGVGRVTMVVDSRDDLGPEFDLRERLYLGLEVSARA